MPEVQVQVYILQDQNIPQAWAILTWCNHNHQGGQVAALSDQADLPAESGCRGAVMGWGRWCRARERLLSLDQVSA